jgi:hypothetical protein
MKFFKSIQCLLVSFVAHHVSAVDPTDSLMEGGKLKRRRIAVLCFTEDQSCRPRTIELSATPQHGSGSRHRWKLRSDLALHNPTICEWFP